MQISYFQAIFLGIIQGLTEFLPVSSSGHLVIVQKIIPDFEQPGVLFDVLLHFGTLFALFYFFRRKIFALSLNYLKLLVLGSIPTAVLGFLFRNFLESTFSLGGIFLASQFLITSLACYFSDRFGERKKEIGLKDSLFIGLAQAISILPAISRSGLTIFAALQRGIDRKTAAEFSFLLSIPAVLGANILEIASYNRSIALDPGIYLVGFAVAFFTGIFSIRLTISLLSRRKFRFFAYYTALVALLSLLVG